MAVLYIEVELFALISSKEIESYSPAIMNRAFAENNIRAEYILMPVNNISKKIILDSGGSGFNITIPYKNDVTKLCDFVSDEVKAIGAVNTIKVIKDGDRPIIKGYNTDISGFSSAIKGLYIPKTSSHALILGSGGSARSVIYALIRSGVGKISILSRNKNSREELKSLFSMPGCIIFSAPLQDIDEYVRWNKDIDLFVNCTPIGMKGYDEDLNLSFFHSFSRGALVFDLVYNPYETIFVKKAAEAGLQASNGLKMLLYQAESAFNIWTGIHFDIDDMTEYIRSIT